MTTIKETPEGFFILVGDIQLRLCFTLATGRDAVQRFADLVQKQENEILAVHKASEAKRQWNYSNPGKGRNWNEFRVYEKMLNQLQALAGIKDS